MADHHRGRRPRERHAVMLGDPIALEPQAFRVNRQIGGVRERLARAPALDDRHQIEE